MTYAIAVFSSVTVAGHVHHLMEKQMKFSAILQTPKGLYPHSCSYSLRFAINDLPLLSELCRTHQIDCKGYYKEVKQGGTKSYEKLL